MRSYIRQADEAQRAVAEIVRLVTSGEAEPLIGLDIETSPQRSLVGYPNTLLDEDGEKQEPKKKDYLLYVQRAWWANFHPERLRAAGLYVPRRLTNGNEAPGIPAGRAWEQFRDAVAALAPAALEPLRWRPGELPQMRAALQGEAEAQQQRIAELEQELEGRPKGRINVLRAELKAVKARLAEVEAEQAMYAEADDAHPMDARLLRHIVLVAVENRVSIDPVRPGLDPHTSDIFLVQFTLRRGGEYLSWIFNMRLVPKEVLLPALQLDRRATYLGANIKFDLAHILNQWLEAPQNVWCVRVASRMLYLGLKMRHSLDYLARRFADIELSKEERNLFVGRWLEEPTEEMLNYAFTDTEVLFPIYDAQVRMAEERGQLDLLRTFSKLSYPTAVWSLAGVELDTERWLAIAAQVSEERDAVAAQLEQMLLPAGYLEAFGALPEAPVVVGEDGEEDSRPGAFIRISQREQVIARLPDVLGEDFLRRIFPDGKISLAKDPRELMETEWLKYHSEPHPFFVLYKRWAKLAKQASTYGRSFLGYIHPLTGRVHSSFNIAGTDTGRYTSVEPNLLNIPTPKGDDDVDFRAAFRAQRGYKFGNADYSAMEQRIAADLTGDPVLIALFEADGDGHSVSAAMMYHVTQGAVSAPEVTREEWKEGPAHDTITKVVLPKTWTPLQVVEYIVKERCFTGKGGKPASLMEVIEGVHKKTTRQSAKTVGLGKQFGMTKYGIARKKNIPLAQAEAIENLYDGVYAVMKREQDRTSQMPFETAIRGADGFEYGYAVAYNGLRRYFRLPQNPSSWEFECQWEFKEAQHKFRKERMAIEREAKNIGTQGGNAVVTAEALLLLVEAGKAYATEPDPLAPTIEQRLGLGIFPWLAIYDEILALVPEDVPEKEANKAIETSMLAPSRKYIKRVPSKAEANPLSDYWQKY